MGERTRPTDGHGRPRGSPDLRQLDEREDLVSLVDSPTLRPRPIFTCAEIAGLMLVIDDLPEG